MSTQRKLLLLLILVLVPVLAWLLFFWQPDQEGGGHGLLNLSLAPEGGDFVVQTADRQLALEDLRGQVVLLYFGYTMCPDICPTNLSLIAQALQRLTPEERGQATVLFVSVDPQRDTPERLKEYAAYFSDRMIGATGTKEEIDRAVKLYGAAYRIVDDGSGAGYLVDHTAFTYLIDRQGRLKKMLPHATPPDKIAEAIRELL